MSTQKKQLFSLLNSLGITTARYSHEPLHTVEQAHEIYDHLGVPGARCKNLFLKDSKKQLYLIVALAGTPIALKLVSKLLKAPELRFADAALLHATLGVLPGSVTPFGLINDQQRVVTVILDKELLAQSLLTFHPLSNDETLTISPADLVRFIERIGNATILVDFKTLQ